MADVIGKVGAFVFLIVGARALSPAEFGSFSYAYAFAVLVAQFPLGGFDSVLIREASQHPEQLPMLVAESYTWRAIISVPVFVVSVAIGILTQPSGEAAGALVAVLVAIFLDTVMRTPLSAAQARKRLGGMALAQLIRRVVMGIAGAAAIGLGLGLGGYAGALLVGSSVGAVATLIAMRSLEVRADFAAVTRAGLRSMGISSVPIGLDVLVSGALLKIDALMLGSIKGDAALAPYAVAYRFVETGLFVAYGVVAAVYPVMSAAGSVERVRRSIERGMIVCAAAYVPFAVAVLFRGDAIVGTLFGSQYQAATTAVVGWLAFVPLLIAYGNLTNGALVSQRRVLGSVLASAAAAVFNIGVNAYLIPRMGAEGAAITTIASYAFEAVILSVLIVRAFGVPRLDRAMVESLVAGLVMAAVFFFVHWGTLIDVAVASVVYGIAWLALNYRFSPHNVAVLQGFLRRARSDEPTMIKWRPAPLDT